MGALCGALIVSLSWGQSTFGSITGIVTDSSGAAVPNAEIAVIRAGTGARRETRAGSTGVFNVPNLDIGTYDLRVTAQGFSTYNRSELKLVSNQVLNVNVELAVGAVTSVVEVSGAASAGGGVLPVIGGTRVQTGTLPTMDGIAVMSYPLGANPVQPSLESVEEVTAVKAVGPAEFRTAANVKVVSKSGTNEFHGSAYC